MLHIILLVLKIIGIVLLSIIGILLLAIACVLFVPMRYRIRLTREAGEDKPPVVAYVKVTWLLHLFNVLIRYPAKVMVRARILIFTLFRVPKKEKKARKEKKRRTAKKTKNEDADNQEIEQQTSQTVTEAYEPFGGDEEDFAPHEEEQDHPEETAGKKSLFAKIGNIFTKIKQIFIKIKEFFENIQYTIQKFCDKIKAVLDNIQYYREVLDSDPFRKSAKLCKKELGWAFRKLKPDKFEADIIIGMEDPATTGEILAVCGMLYPLVGPYVQIVGDFESEKTHIEGRLYIRGRIRVITFLRTALRIYFSNDIKKMINMLKKEAV